MSYGAPRLHAGIRTGVVDPLCLLAVGAAVAVEVGRRVAQRADHLRKLDHLHSARWDSEEEEVEDGGAIRWCRHSSAMH